jgi:hypothetical protein
MDVREIVATAQLFTSAVRPGASGKIIQKEFPQLREACCDTYWSPRFFHLVNAQLECPAGYVLAAALSAEKLYQEKHTHRPVSRACLDRAFAAEVYYHFRRGRKFSRPAAALWTCFHNLIIERPEKLQGSPR